jgi:hypothetical protein
MSELTSKQLTTAIISSTLKVTADESKDKDEDSTPKKSNQVGNAFGGKKSAKRSRTSK